MVTRGSYSLIITVLLAVVLAFNGCKRDLDLLSPATYPSDAEIFTDGFGPGVQFESFGDAKLDALQISTDEKYDGTSSLKITVPSDGNKFGTYAGGAFVSGSGRNLTGYNALTFWAKSSIEAKMNVAGIGNDNTGTSKFIAQQTNLPLHTIWTKYVFPIPNPAKLTKEKGLFFFAAANVSGSGFNIWLDDIKYETVGTLAYPRLTIATKTVTKVGGDTLHIDDPSIIFNLDGTDETVQASASYLTCVSSDSSVAVVDAYGVVTAVGAGTANITAKLGNIDATGKVTINSIKAVGPTVPAPTPGIDSTVHQVISLFSNKYNNVPVNSFAAPWGTGKVRDTVVAGNDVKLYTNLGYAGIDFSSHLIDATNMAYLHIDMWTIYPTAAPAVFKVKLVDFGADGVSTGGDNSESELSFTATSTPPLVSGSWVSFDIPLANFMLNSQAHLGQLIISGDLKTVWLDNIFFYQGTGARTVPAAAPPRPAFAASNVISLLSNAYTNVNTNWATYWQYSTAVVNDKIVGGDNMKLFTSLNFAGIDFSANEIDATSMQYFHMDIWTPDTIKSSSVFKILLVDFGANGVYGGGDDTQQELTFNATSTPPLATGTWVSFDIPLSNFTGLKNRAHLAQLVISAAGGVATVWVDNVYFHK